MIPETIGIDLLEVIGIAIALSLSSLFSAAETAITSLSSLKAKQLVENNHPAQRSLGLWLNHPGRVLTTVLIFKSIVNVLVAALTTDIAVRHLSNQAIGIATGVATFLVLVFGEVFPKSFAKAHHELLAVPALRLVYGIYLLTFPVVWVFAELALRLIRLGGEREERPPITEEELEYLVDVGERHGVIEETKKEMIEGVFDFDETKVREIMTPRPDIRFLRIDADYDDALALATETGMSRIPVCDEDGVDHIIGILLVKDLLRVARALSGGPRKVFRLRDVMREPFFVPESKLIMDVFKELKSSKNHIAIVIDEHGGTAGLVTMEDILEEIVGEIQDEYDVEEAEVVELDPGIYDIVGSYNIDEFLAFFDLDEKAIAEERGEDVDTIAGWITALAGDLPEVGKKVRIGPLNVEVSDVERRRVKRVRVSKVIDEGEAAPQPGS